MAKVRVAIGSEIYLFKEPQGFAPACVISAHGIYRNTTPNAPAIGVTLHFYCKHGQTVDDLANITEFKWQRPRIEETIPRQGVPSYTDYILSKYQASHKEAATGLADIAGESYNLLLGISFPGFDIVTVRRRFWMQGMNLSTVLRRVYQHHAYGAYHCLFCRELK